MSRKRWWRHGWGAASIGVIGLLVGTGCGAAGKTVTKTVTAEERPTTVQVGTQTETTAPSESPSDGGSAGSYSGTGPKNVGILTVPRASIIRWHGSGGFGIIATEEPDSHVIRLTSGSASGEEAIEAGTYHEVDVLAPYQETWSFTIVPRD
jgi:hypothetical protein